MAKFSASSVERLDYDFTAVPKDGGDGYCTGKGTIPEPSQKDLEEYFEVMAELAPNLPGDHEDDVERVTERNGEEELLQLLQAVATLCKQSPSTEELMELPPRIKIAFIRWIQKEFSDPEVSSAGTRR